MGWDTPGGYRDPKERAAAEEMARRAEAERQLEDARTQAVADAVRLGFADLACAIVTAAGPEAITVWRQRQADLRAGGHIPAGGDCSLLGNDFADHDTGGVLSDGDLDDLIDKPQN